MFPMQKRSQERDEFLKFEGRTEMSEKELLSSLRLEGEKVEKMT